MPIAQNAFTCTLTNATPGYYDGGLIEWTSGANNGLRMEVKTYDVTGQLLRLFLPMPYPYAVGDTFTIYPGCDKKLSTCKNKFSNVINFRGEPYLPGYDKLVLYPDAKQ